MSLRLRGAKVELEEAGLETENMAESTATLQKKLLALTGGKVDIMLDADTFKSTTQILREMSDAWSDMTDIERASALELMGGKRQANILASVIKNFDTVEEVIVSSMNSSNSALEENAKYLDSIQGKIDQFTNSLETMWSHFLDDDLIKDVVDFGTTLIKFMDDIGLGWTALIGAILLGNGKIIGTGIFDWFEKLGTKKSTGLFKSIGESFKNVNKATVSAGSALGIFKTGADGAFAGLTKLGVGLGAAGLAIGAVVAVISSYKKASQEAASNARESANAVAEQNESLQDYKDEITKLRKELDSGNLSEQEAYEVRKQLISIQDDLVSKYGDEAKAINLVTGEIEAQKNAIDELQKANANAWLNDFQKQGWGKSAYKQAEEAVTTKGIATATVSWTEVQDDFKEVYGDSWEEFYDDANREYIKFVSSLGADNLYTGEWGFSFDSVTRDEAIEKFGQITSWLRDYAAKTGNKIQFTDLIGGLQNNLDDFVGKDYDTHKANWEAYLENTAMATYTSQYNAVLEAQDALQKALISGTTEDVIAANDQLTNAIAAAATAAGEDEWMVNWFNGLDDQYEAAIKRINFKAAWANNTGAIKDSIVSAVDAASNEIGHKLEGQELLVMQGHVNTRKNRFGELEFSWQAGSETYSQAQKDAYEKIAQYAEDYNIELNNAIALLTEFGVLQGDVFSKEAAAAAEAQYQTISQLTDSYDKYSAALATASEFIANGVAITEEYKTTLSELIDDHDALASCFDENNGLLVTNVDLLQELLQESKDNMAANAKLAKSQAQLKYYKLVKQLSDTLKTTTKLDSATKKSVETTLDQIDAVELAISKYSQLEDTLLGTTNAFTKFRDAQEIDDLNTYGDTYVEMAQTMYDAFYKTGKVGTEANWAAIEALVPDHIYAGLTEDADRMAAIYDYFNNHILPTLTLDEDELSLGFKNIESFVQKAIDTGVFEGDTEKFNLVEGMDLKEASKLLKMTEEQVYALFAEIDKYNTSGSESSLVEQAVGGVEGDILRLSSELERLNKQKLALLDPNIGGYEANKKQIDEINKDIATTSQELNDLRDDAYDVWKAYTQNGAAITALEAIDNKQQQLTQEFAMQIGLDFSDVAGKNVQEVLDELLAQKLELEEPTVLHAQFAVDEIDSQIAYLYGVLMDLPKLEVYASVNDTSVDEAILDISTKIDEFKKEKASIAETFGLELSEEEQKELKDELAAIEEFTINDKTFKISIKNFKVVKGQLADIAKLVGAINDAEIGYNPDPGRTGTAIRHGITYSAYADGTSGAPRTETALVGELGPELRVRDGRWETIGNNGAEFTDVRRGDIIFNHKQTEQLLKHGYTTSRGKAFASGTAYAGLQPPVNSINGTTEDDDSEQLIDFIEIKLEEIEHEIAKTTANIETFVDDITKIAEKRAEYDTLIAKTQAKMQANSDASLLYSQKAAELLAEIPAEYRGMAQNGAIAVEEFVGKQDVEIADAINKYRDYASKANSAELAVAEATTEIASLALQKITDIADDFDNLIGLVDAQSSLLQTNMDLVAEQGHRLSSKYYEELIGNANENIANLQSKKSSLMADLNSAVSSGEIIAGSDEWYEAVNLIMECDEAIVNCKLDIEEFNNAIRDLKWDNLDKFIDELDNVESQLSHLYDLLADESKVVDEMGEWTNDGIAALGLLAQKMELAQYKAQQYGDAIKQLDKDYAAGIYSTDEYNEKLAELTESQWDEISAFESAKDAIVDLNKTRIDAVKDGMQKEIDAYKELIEAKKESLDADKEAHDFAKDVAEKQKTISTIQRQLAAIANNNSAEATAKRKQLQAELLEANTDLEETYYDHSIDTQKDALDREYDAFEKNKKEEMELLDKWLEEQEKVIQESFEIVKENATVILSTINGIASDYGVQISAAVSSPWTQGENALSSYSGSFNSMIANLSAAADGFVAKLNEIRQAQQGLIDSADSIANGVIGSVNQSYNDATSSSGITPRPSTPGASTAPPAPTTPTQTGSTIKVGGKINAAGALIYDYAGDTSGEVQFFRDDPIYTVLKEQNGWIQARWHKTNSGITGWFRKQDVRAYAKGTTGTPKDGLALIDELGEELVMAAGPNGRLQYLSKGTGVVPADLTENIMQWGQLDPTEALNHSKVKLGAPTITTNNFDINLEFGSLVHVDAVSHDTLPELQNIVRQEFNGLVKQLNGGLKRYTR